MKIIRGIVFQPDSVDIQYMDDAGDVRLEGMVYVTHNITIARDGNYDDGIRELEEATQDLLTDVLGDFAVSMPFDPNSIMPTDDDDDEDEE